MLASILSLKSSWLNASPNLHPTLLPAMVLGISLWNPFTARADDLKVGDPAPVFKAKTQANGDFDLSTRKGQWTVLYFYPKAETPGCTKQACMFRDNIKAIREQGGEVFGVSADTVEAQAKFHAKHNLNFTLLADPDDHIINLFGTKMPMIGYSKRWTFIIDPELKIRAVEKDVDPVKDATRVSELIGEFKKTK